MTPEQFRQHGHEVVDWIADYWSRIGSLPVRSQVAPGEVREGLPATAPERGEPFAAVLADLDRVVLPGTTHWQHPGFFGYFPANTSGPSVLGDLVSAGLGVQGMSWVTSPAATCRPRLATSASVAAARDPPGPRSSATWSRPASASRACPG